MTRTAFKSIWYMKRSFYKRLSLVIRMVILATLGYSSADNENITVIEWPKHREFSVAGCVEKKFLIDTKAIICPNRIEVTYKEKLKYTIRDKIAFANVIKRGKYLYFQTPLEVEDTVIFPYRRLNVLNGIVENTSNFEAVYDRSIEFSFLTNSCRYCALDIDGNTNLRINTYFNKKSGKTIVIGPRSGCTGKTNRASVEYPELYGFRGKDIVLSAEDSCGKYFVYISYQNQVLSQNIELNLIPLRLGR